MNDGMASKSSKVGAEPWGAALDSTLGADYAAGTITLTELNHGAADIGEQMQTAPPDPPVIEE
jgi:hypothetical protein